MKRVLWILVTPTLILLILGLIVQYLIFPKFADWFIQQAQQKVKEETQLNVSIKSSQLSLLRLSVYLNDIVVDGVIPAVETPLKVERVQVRLDALSLILGELRIAAVIVDSPEIILNLDTLPKSNKPMEGIPVEEIFKWAQKIPLERVAIRRGYVQVQSKKADLSVDIRPLDALLSNHVQTLSLRLFAPSLMFKSTKLPEPAHFSYESVAIMDAEKLRIELGKVMSLGQTLLLTSEFKNLSKIFVNPQGEVQISASSDLKPLSERMQKIFGVDLPDLLGHVQLESQFQMHGTHDLRGYAKLSTRDVQIDDIKVGGLSTRINLEGDSLRFSRLDINHPAGTGILKNASFKMTAPYQFQAEVDATHLDLQELFQSLNLTRIPVWLQLKGHLPCSGQINDFFVDCTGTLSGQGLVVKSSITARPPSIVEVDNLQAQGQVRIDAEKVFLKSQLQVGQAVGEVEGVVGYKTGFNYHFKTDSISFADIKVLAGLDFVGVTALEGSTKGDADSATLQMKLRVKDFKFENYLLGQLGGDLRYQKGHLYLEKLQGYMDQTQYHGDLDLNLKDDRISGSFEFPQTNLADLKKIFSEVYLFPLDVQGSGQGQVQFEGPLNFWRMSYQLHSQFNDGRIHGDSFSSLDFNVSSHEGLISADNIELRKGASALQMKGQITREQKSELQFVGHNWRLEESEILASIRNDLIGAFNFSGEITGPVVSPEIKIRGHLAEILVNDTEVPSSFFEFRLNKDLWEGQANLFGSKIQGDFTIPFTSKQALKMRVRTADWNFSSALGLFGASQLQDEYQSQLTSDIDLYSESGDFTELTGSINVKNFFLQRGHSSVKNDTPLEISLQKGVIRLKDFVLSGPNTDIRIDGDNFTLKKLNLNVHAKSDLRLAHIFLPFLEDLGGPFQLQASISGRYDKPEILGNAKVENTFIKLKGFPHPVERLRVDLIFSQTRILLQNIKGFLGGGNLSGEGSVLIRGINDIPTMVRLRAEGLSLNVPDKVKTQGSANLTFSGNWFPFTLGGTYNVSSGLFEKEFTEGPASAVQVRESIYLPRVLKDGSFDPVVLDLQVNLDRNMLVKNAQVDGAVSGQLQVKGPPQDPLLFGKINIDKDSKLIFKDKIFEVTTGNVNFNNNKELNPDIYLTAQSRVSDYDISLLVQGPSKDPLIRLSSVPPLPESEIVSLLALGVTSDSLAQTGGRDQATQLGFEAGSVLLNQSPINKFFESRLGGKLEFTSSFDSTKNANIPKLTFRKRISRKWETSVSRGVGTDQNPTEVKLNYQINNNLSAVGSWEGREAQEGTSVRSGTQESLSIFGLDLEFKREFK